MSKYFIIDESVTFSPKEEIEKRHKEKLDKTNEKWLNREQNAQAVFDEECTLKHTHKRVIVKSNLQLKNYTTFDDGTKIRLERQFNNFNRRQTEPVNATVVSAEYIPTGSEILISHNALHDTSRIFDYVPPSGNESIDIGFFSIPEYDCFAWRDTDGQLKPMKHFDFALRVFKPCTGVFVGLRPIEIKDVLYVTTGELRGNVVKTLKGCDYVIVYQDTNGKEGNIIRFRPFGNPEEKREEEAVAILNDLTEQVNNGELFIGLTNSDCKTLKEYHG